MNPSELLQPPAEPLTEERIVRTGRIPMQELGMLLTVRQAAERVQLTEQAIRQRIRRGQIGVVRLGTSIRIPEVYLERALGLDSHESQPS